jgi:phosphoglycerate kinase
MYTLTLPTHLTRQGVEFILPTDVIIADKFAPDADTKTVSIDAIPDGWMGLDIGPDSLKTFQGALADAKTVIWNGPMGVFEFDAFAKGTYGVADTLAELTPKARRPPPPAPSSRGVRLGLRWRLGTAR